MSKIGSPKIGSPKIAGAKISVAKAAKIKVLIADDHAILRSGLRMLIESQPDMTVVAEAQNGEEAIQFAGETRPDVVILDISMPERGGMSSIAEILKSHRPVRVLLLTMHEELAYLRTALAAGASGYVLKKSVDADLLSAIRAVNRGRTYVDSELASGLLGDAIPNLADHQQTRQRREATEVLSERELQVLKLVAEGFSSREIAEQILVGTKTVETYRGRFVEKLGLTSRADVVRYALEVGLLSPEKFSSPAQREKRATPAAKSASKGTPPNRLA
jgi:two-component system response regulator NreC